jgi:hypothetical protein
MYLQINTVKYYNDREITNIYENLQIVRSQFFTDLLLFVYIRSTSNIYWFIGIRICCQRVQIVANAKFSLLKLLIYEPYYCYALVGWSARPRLEPSRAIGTLEPFLGHLALG